MSYQSPSVLICREKIFFCIIKRTVAEYMLYSQLIVSLKLSKVVGCIIAKVVCLAFK